MNLFRSSPIFMWRLSSHSILLDYGVVPKNNEKTTLVLSHPLETEGLGCIFSLSFVKVPFQFFFLQAMRQELQEFD